MIVKEFDMWAMEAGGFLNKPAPKVISQNRNSIFSILNHSTLIISGK